MKYKITMCMWKRIIFIVVELKYNRNRIIVLLILGINKNTMFL